MITISTTSVHCIVWYSLQTRASVTTVRVNTRHEVSPLLSTFFKKYLEVRIAKKVQFYVSCAPYTKRSAHEKTIFTFWIGTSTIMAGTAWRLIKIKNVFLRKNEKMKAVLLLIKEEEKKKKINFFFFCDYQIDNTNIILLMISSVVFPRKTHIGISKSKYLTTPQYPSRQFPIRF